MPAQPGIQLSKSAFVNGRQCPKRLWLQVHGPDSSVAPVRQTDRFDPGRELQYLARTLFPGGISASPKSPDAPSQLEMTRSLIASGTAVIFDAFVHADGLTASADILVRKGTHWDIIDVRRGTSIKGYYLHDLAFQYHVFRRAGVPVSRCFVLHVHNGYVRYGPIMPESLFQRVNLTRQVQMLQSDVLSQVQALLPLLQEDAAMPGIDIGPHCSSPHPCPFMDNCWGHIPTPSVFDIIHLGGERKFALYYQGVFRQEDLPHGYQLTAIQQMQVRATVSGRPHVDPVRLVEWLSGLRYPLSLVDFECFQPAVPLYDGTKPYQQIPFQFSVHCTDSPGGHSTHVEFLAEAGPDPRPAFLAALLQAVGSAGTVLAYNKAFEADRLKELARSFPELAEPILSVVSRMRDLMEPFERKWLYVPAMQGSHSIKQVLPALVPGAHYDHLEIANGQQAAVAFESLLYEDDAVERDKVRTALLAYCKLDTQAMVMIMDRIYSESGGYTAPGDVLG
jgi:hypothetical protein